MTFSSPPAPRRIGAVNWLGLWTLIVKETERFMTVYVQSILAPTLTSLLYFIVFSFAFGNWRGDVDGVPYLTFLAPGLIMMSIAQHSFLNTVTSLLVSKIQGNIVDVVMTPLSPVELTIGYVMGGVIRGFVVGAASIICLAPLAHLTIHSLFFVLYHGIMGSMMLSCIGLISGLWAEKFDQLAVVENFLIMPATFLSGTFYDARRLPEIWQTVCHFNPFFYMIDGFRYGFTGISDGTLLSGVAVMLIVNIVLLWTCWHLVASGYKLKA